MRLALTAAPQPATRQTANTLTGMVCRCGSPLRVCRTCEAAGRPPVYCARQDITCRGPLVLVTCRCVIRLRRARRQLALLVREMRV